MNFSAEIPAYLPDGHFWVKAIFCNLLLLEDRFVFSKHGVTHCANIKLKNQKLTIPCHFTANKTSINNVEIVKNSNWQHKHWGYIKSYYSHLPYFDYLAPEIKPLYFQNYDTIGECHLKIIKYIKYLWRLPVKIQLASNIFESSLPDLYIQEWHSHYLFENYLLYNWEEKYLRDKINEAKWEFKFLQVNNKKFANELLNDVLYLLFTFGIDFPGLAKKYVSKH